MSNPNIYGLFPAPADIIPSMRKLIAKAEAPPKKKKADTPPPPKITHGQVWVSQQFVGWQEAVLRALQVGTTCNLALVHEMSTFVASN